MEPFVRHTGVGVPLRRTNVDTDQILPSKYLKRVARSGYEDGLFAAWRQDPDFVLNREPYRQGSVLVAGPDFGTGSSRETAVWALQNYGFRAVIAPRFGDIFRSNATKSGLLVVPLREEVVSVIWDYLDATPGESVTVDLEDQIVTVGDITEPFTVDPYVRWQLLAGLDEIAITLESSDLIVEHEQNDRSFTPDVFAPTRGSTR